MSTEDTIRNLRKRRGIARASITRLATSLDELERKVDEPSTVRLAERLVKRLEVLELDFKTNHLSLIDHIDEEVTLGREQDVLDAMDDKMAQLSVRLQLSAQTTPVPPLVRLYLESNSISEMACLQLMMLSVP
jgi:transcriptional regulator with XRE-family HTH domain